LSTNSWGQAVKEDDQCRISLRGDRRDIPSTREKPDKRPYKRNSEEKLKKILTRGIQTETHKRKGKKPLSTHTDFEISGELPK